MAELKIQHEFICLKCPVLLCDWEKPFWTKSINLVGCLTLDNSRVVYKSTYLQLKYICGVEVYEAKHTITLFHTSGQKYEIQFEEETSYASAITALEKVLLIPEVA
jgi:hypothetical protein